MGSELRIAERGARLRWSLSSILLLISFACAATLPRNTRQPTRPSLRSARMERRSCWKTTRILPLSNPTQGNIPRAPIDYKAQLGRATSLRSEPANAPLAASRFFVIDQSHTIYILDKDTKKFTPYIDFDRIFPKFVSRTGNTPGVVSIQFDPGYAKNGKFYTVHVEKPDLEGSAAPTNAQMPSLNLDGYTVTPAVNPPAGPAHLESVLIEWTDTNIRNATFEGTAREILRVGFDRNHPMADLIFNPLARPAP